MTPFSRFSFLMPALSIALAISASAESSRRPSPFAYDKAHESTFQGTIQKVTSKPAGRGQESLSLVVVTGQSTREFALGSFLPKDVAASLVAGKPIQFIGAVQTFKGRQTLMVRELVLGGRTVEVRNEHGFFIRPNYKPIEFHHTAAAQGTVRQGAKQ